jgi:hypothetical protein
MKSYFTPAQVAGLVPGLTVRTLIDMTEKGVITPAVDTPGQGNPRQYDEENIFQISVAFELRRVLSPSQLKSFMRIGFAWGQSFDTLKFQLLAGSSDLKVFGADDDPHRAANNPMRGRDRYYRHISSKDSGPFMASLAGFVEGSDDNECDVSYLEIILNVRKIRGALKI